jgi:uncharacterized repeat protein (TIGR04138 family)
MTQKSIDEISKEDGRYDSRALKFIFEGLGTTIQRIREAEEADSGPHHISGQELAEGLARIAVERWGRLARIVLQTWGIKTTRDFGEVVYLMISHGWMSAQQGDTIEDFDHVFDFETVFEKQFDFEIN